MPIVKVIAEPGKVPVKIWASDIEDQKGALGQLSNISLLPFIHKHVAVMADAHWGMGSTVGSVVPTIRAIVPSAVGVDIGCGMMAHKLNLNAKDLPDSLKDLRTRIEKAVPHGRTDNGGLHDRGAWGDLPLDVSNNWNWLLNDKRLLQVLEKHKNLLHGHKNGGRHLGTLGTGNHFIELCLDTDNNVWIMLHSGSRGIGNRIGVYFIGKAKEEMERWHIKLPDPDLAYLVEDSQYFDDYWKALSWAQDYAAVNRKLMMDAVKRVIAESFGPESVRIGLTVVNCHHNYVELENHYGRNVYVTRKGAVRARENDLGIIPGSMGTRSYIVRGKGNPESFHSCSHGAGRRMSRGDCKKTYGVSDVVAQTFGVECKKDDSVIDEIPSAYKPIDEVMKNQTDLVEVVTELKQVICVKG